MSQEASLSGIDALIERRKQPLFGGWAGFVSDERMRQSVGSVTQLIDDLVALGSTADESSVEKSVRRCVECFNDIDDGWITTIEREEICDAISQIVSLGGLTFDEAWLDARDF